MQISNKSTFELTFRWLLGAATKETAIGSGSIMAIFVVVTKKSNRRPSAASLSRNCLRRSFVRTSMVYSKRDSSGHAFILRGNWLRCETKKKKSRDFNFQS